MNYTEVVNNIVKPSKTIAPIEVGDIVQVGYKIKEGDKERIQIFEGRIISIRNGLESFNCNFTVRRNTGKFVVERIFPLYSPNIEFVNITSRSKTRRAKLFFLRDRKSRYKFKENKVNIKSSNIPKGIEIEEVSESNEDQDIVQEEIDNIETPLEETQIEETQQSEESKE